ncbi:ABC transporter permease EcsB [Staphylococcus canis]|uniref:ABC transporter permease n=1 Tax=Staphylococcus canis TaxID=2724942 RepID=A0ABS0TAL7_9STAP|nr:ABC transporter permease [Staphylococcus canis]MBI5975795.1 ABC transporter permease [Staphylococcus canis]
MMSSKQLFQKRLKALRKEKNYYYKFIFNGHFAIFLMILLGAFILGYGQWLKHIPMGINYTLIISILLAIVSIFPLKTLIEEADQLFLLPFEKEMTHYMKHSIQYSYISRLPIQILVLVIIFPLYNTLHPNQLPYFLVVVVLALIFPYFGLILRWQWYLFGLENWSCNVVLFIINLSGYYVILDALSYFGFGSIIGVMALILLLKQLNVQKQFPWIFMSEEAKRHRMNYYKFVNMFTDVKGIKAPAVRRKYLDVFLRRPKQFDADHMYPYLFTRNFLRGKDAFNIVLRLLIGALILMVWLNQPIVSAIIGALTMYIVVLQMSQFYTQEAYNLWPQVWPVAEIKVIEGYRKFLNMTVILLGLILSVVYILMNLHYFYVIVLFFVVGFLTVNSTIKKLKYQESLLKD